MALTPASVVITPVIVAVVISVTAGMTGMGGTSLRRSNSDIAVLGSPDNQELSDHAIPKGKVYQWKKV